MSTSSADRPSLLIVGGGITGLVSAYLAAREGWSVTVVEGASRAGGLLETFEVGGTRLEHYYHHFFTHDLELRWLLEQLGLTDKLIFRKATMGVFRRGGIYDFNTPQDLLKFPPLSLPGKIRFGLTSLYLGKKARWQDLEGVPALEWFHRYAGRAATEAIWEPMLRIKFGPYADQVPAAWMAGRLRQRMSSRESGDERLGYLEGSLQTLLDALLLRLEKLGVRVVTGARVGELVTQQGALTGVRTTAGDFSADKVLATIPTLYLAPLLRPVNEDYAREVARIEYFGAVCTIFETDRSLSPIYWLNVADPGFPFGGVIEHTNFIRPEVYGGKHLIYLSRYFESANPLATATQDQIIAEMTAPLGRIYPGFSPGWIRQAWAFRSMTAATVCDLNFSRKVLSTRTPIPNLHLAGMVHVYPDERSTNNSVRIAAEACRALGIKTDDVPKGFSLSAQIGME